MPGDSNISATYFKVLKSRVVTDLKKKFKFLMQYLLSNTRQKRDRAILLLSFGFVINDNAALHWRIQYGDRS